MNLENNDIFIKNVDTLHNLSYDSSNNEWMTNSTDNAYSFDLIKREYCNSKGLSEERAFSVDAVIERSDKIYFIEFKNGEIKGQKKKEIKEKGDESIMIFCDMFETNISMTRDNIIYILVYNSDKNRLSEQDKVAKARASLSNEHYAVFGLDAHRGLCFQDIFTMNQSEFDNWLNQ